MSSTYSACPHCGKTVERFLNPAPTVDVIIHHPDRGVVLISRANPPLGHALPGGFVDEGESTECAAVREAFEETHLRVRLTGLLGVYSDPRRDPRRHTLSAVYTAETDNPDDLRAGDDAAQAAFYPLDALPSLVFDHERIVRDFMDVLAGKHALTKLAYPLEG